MRTYSEYLAGRDEFELTTLLRKRPDLLYPAPSSLRALVAHATARASVHRALAHLDATSVQVLEAISVLGSEGKVTEAGIRQAISGKMIVPDDVTALTSAVSNLHELALIWESEGSLRAAPGVADALGPYIAGFGGASAEEPAQPLTPAALATLLKKAPLGASELLQALTWGPPVGKVSASATGARGVAVQWLIERDLLTVADADHVMLPRRVGLALRGDRTHRGVVHKPEVEAIGVGQVDVDHEAARAAMDAVRLATALLEVWGEEPAVLLRAGGIPVRELRRTALSLDVPSEVAADVVEVAAWAGIVAADGESPAAMAPVAAAAWGDLTVPQRWARLALALVDSPRTSWSVGMRDERGTARAALAADGERAWVVSLRWRVLGVLRANLAMTMSAESIHEVLTWESPRSIPPLSAVEALLDQLTRWGLVARGALSTAGIMMAQNAGSQDDPEDQARPLVVAIDAILPEPINEVLLQADLTGVVPGRPSPELERLLETAGDVETRGAGLTVRFTSTSLLRALDSGLSVDELRDNLAAHSVTPIPQPLEYLIADTARRHGSVRVGAASSYVRVADPAMAAMLVAHSALAAARPLLLAPTVIAAHVSAATLAGLIRQVDVSPVFEGADGQLVLARPHSAVIDPSATDHNAGTVWRTPSRMTAATSSGGHTLVIPEVPDEQLITKAVAKVLASAAAPEPDDAGSSDPAGALGVLREAADSGQTIRIKVVGNRGVLETRDVVVISADAGRVRVKDLARDNELTVAVHRLIDAEVISG